MEEFAFGGAAPVRRKNFTDHYEIVRLSFFLLAINISAIIAVAM